MSKNGKIDYPDGNDDREDIQWFENYEKCSKTKHLERLKNEDILNYIKDVEQNCRLEVSSGDEDYAGTKKSSNCSARCSGTRFKSLKKVKSRVTRKNKNITLKRKTKRSSDHNATGACNYCCSTREFHFRSNPDLIVRENSRKDLNTFTKSAYQHPNLPKYSYKHQATSPTFRGWYSRENRKGWPTITKMASLEVIKNWSQDAIHNSRNNKSKITDRKSAKVHTFKSLLREKLDDSTYKNYPSITSNEKTTERNSRYSDRKQEKEIRMRKLNEESDISDFMNQQPLNKIYSCRDMAFSYQAPLQDGDYKRYYTSKYPVRRYRQPTSWDLSSRSNRLTESARLPERSSLLQKQTSQWVSETGPPLKAFSPIMEASIDRSYQRETKRRNNTNQRRRNPNVLGEREPSCYRRPGLLRESGKLCQVVRTREDKQRLDCSCKNAEQDETKGYLRYCCSENVNDFIRPQYKSRPSTMSKRANYTTLRRTLSESVQSQDNDEGKSEFNLSMGEDSQNEKYDNYAFDVFDDVRTTYDDAIDVEYLKPRVSFPDDQARRGSNEVARKYKKSSNDLKRNQGKSTVTRTTLRNKITARYPKGKEFSFATRKPVSGDFSGLRYDAAESTCECKEPFHDPPATCLTGSCTCIGNAKRNDSDSSHRISDTIYNCCCCSCSSSTSHDEKNPVKKLESFCERVKAVNQDIFHKSSKSTSRNLTRNAQEYVHGDSDEQDQSEFSTQRVSQRARSTEGERLADHARLRLEKSKHSHDEANLEKILIYPPRGESGLPLTLYKRSSNISCRVKGDADTGFRYIVTYVQKFVSPTWMPSLTPQDPSWEIDEGYSCSADYG
ncbi:hypothetical protein ALC60_14661 [Trachymyrmex zeteki]|uniref:Uncharacterized protein n=1 Tax=Mycetomoellerius zeteki TaxID=64791 RepID=A0A151WEF1_9HYME|nr:hypothetical protein ALC60_14661 [Trachymyrmex zeteki]